MAGGRRRKSRTQEREDEDERDFKPTQAAKWRKERAAGQRKLPPGRSCVAKKPKLARTSQAANEAIWKEELGKAMQSLSVVRG